MPKVSQGRARISQAMLGLTHKQTKFVQNVCDPNVTSNTQAAIQAGYSSKTAYHIGYENVNKPQIQSAIIQLLNQSNISKERLLSKLSNGLESTKLITSPTEPDREVTDYNTIHKYMVTGLQLHGLLSNNDSNNGSIPMNINTDKLLILIDKLS